MKTILLALALALTGRELWAQTPPGLPAFGGGRLPRTAVTNANPGTPPRFPRTPPAAAAPRMTPFASAPASAESEEIIPTGTINWQGLELNQVLEIYAKYVGRTLLRANLPDVKIILKTETPLTKTEVIQALQAVLALNGISVVNIGDKFVKVLPSDQANTAAAELDRSSATNLPNLGSYVTHITQLHYVKPSVMMPFIIPFAKLPNSVSAIDDNGILVIRDYAENVKRMLEMIEQIDVSVPAEYISEVVPIRYAKVDEIASALNSLGGSGGGATVSIGSSTASTPISGLGNRTGGMSGLNSGIGGNNYQSGGIGGGSTFGGRTTSMGGTTAANPNGTPTTGSTFASRLNSIIQRASSPAGAAAGGGSGQDQIVLFGQTKIIPNESSSTLLIYATRTDMAVITNIIAKLDVPLAQVLIEAVIIDYSLGPNTFNFGVSAAQNPATLGGTGTGANSTVGAGGVNGASSFLNFLTGTVGTNSGSGSAFNNNAFANSLGGGLSYFGNIGPSWDVAMTAVAADSHASVIQRPRIQTSQAKPAQFFVGSTVPYVTGNSYGSAYGNGVSYSQLSVGVELDVTPFINPEGLVVMDIQQEIDDLNGYTKIDNVGNVPNTIKRTLNAEIAVKDKDTVMLGGFIKSDKSTARTGVPLLMDIPLIGSLFTQRSDSKGREELIVMMRPTVLQTPELAAKNTVKEQQRLPGISAAAAESAAEERKLIDAQRKREQTEFKHTKQYDGFFVPPPADEPANSAPDNSTSNPSGPNLSPAQTSQLNGLLNQYMAGQITKAEYEAARQKILSAGR